MIPSMTTKDTAVYTEHFAVATTPKMKRQTEAIARKRGVTKSVIVRWALDEYFAAHADTTKAKEN
jgi:hypothetical protein